ncbi:MAG: penicillin acylase family protein, partial [Thermoanaerobaculia bacterium]
LLRRDLLGEVGEARMAQLMPAYPIDGLSILTESGGPVGAGGSGRSGGSSGSGGSGGPGGLELGGAGTIARSPQPNIIAAFFSSLSAGDPAVGDFLTGASREGLGSNNWVVDGTLTASGKPLLANDPHLGSRLPSTWYLAHISAGDFDVIGGTFPGTPAIALGRNRFIAWGATNVAADVEDLFREHLDASGTHSEFRGVQEPIATIPETILVKGAAPVQLNVRVTRHGPLVSDAINVNNAESTTTPKLPPVEPLAFRWTALDPDDGTLTAFLKVNDARNWAEFTDALKGYVVPSQNFVYADVDGHIGYYAPGRIPIRASGDGSRPADGWTGNAEWTGWVPFEELPHTFDPPEHFIVTANHRPEPKSYRYNLGLEWTEPYRAQRIVDLLHQLKPHAIVPDDFARMQADTVSLHARALVPLLLSHTGKVGPRDRPALDLLRRWNFDATRDSAAAALFQAWFLHLTPALVAGKLGPATSELYQGKFTFVARFLAGILSAPVEGEEQNRSPDSPWCDDGATAQLETCDDVVAAALRKGIEDLQQRLGPDMTRWRWETIHRAMFPHALDSVAALRPLLSRSIGIGGDWSTVDVGVTSADHPYEVHTLPGYREIIDLSADNDSRFIDDVGESGHFLSPHYDDFLHDWRAVRHRKMRMDRADIERGALGHLRIVPERSR